MNKVFFLDLIVNLQVQLKNNFFSKSKEFFCSDGVFAGKAEKQSVQSFQRTGSEGPGGKVCVCVCVCVCL